MLGVAGLTAGVRYVMQRGEYEYANKVLSAMRYAFGGHLEKRG